jgi:hypothetical protein
MSSSLAGAPMTTGDGTPGSAMTGEACAARSAARIRTFDAPDFRALSMMRSFCGVVAISVESIDPTTAASATTAIATPPILYSTVFTHPIRDPHRIYRAVVIKV